MKYAIADAPGTFGRQTEIVSVHSTYGAALAHRSNLRLAVYEVGDDTDAGWTLHADMMPKRADRDPRKCPPSRVEMQGGKWYVGALSEDRASRPNIYSLERGDGDIVAGPFASRAEADKAEKDWRRKWSGTPRREIIDA